jgi:putative endonuclease
MLKNQSGALYIGVTKDVEKRLRTHNTKQGALFTKTKGKFHTVFLEEHETLSQARTREIQIKKWRREKKENLIQRFANGQPTKQASEK